MSLLSAIQDYQDLAVTKDPVALRQVIHRKVLAVYYQTKAYGTDEAPAIPALQSLAIACREHSTLAHKILETFIHTNEITNDRDTNQ